MRISLLEEREDFDKILKTTLEETTFFKNRKGLKEEKYFINKYLNFIATNTLSGDVFQTLINEYSSSLTWWKKGIQFIYVNLATSKSFRSIFAQRNIKLSEDFKEYLILGGNHRLRLFYGELKDSIVILKSGESQKFIENDIAIRTENNLSYAPQIFDSENDWLREEYFNGIPFNRLESEEKQVDLQKVIISNHLEELLVPTSKDVPLKDYIQLVEKEIFSLLSNEKIKVKKEVSTLIKKVFDTLFTKLSSETVKTSWSHGDFQAANILVSEGSYKVIDWEASNKRFYLYDVFTFLSQIRSNISLTSAIDTFKKTSIKFEKTDSGAKDKIILLLIEELRFNMNEEFSENFYFSGQKTEKLCHSITSYIHD
ncbi:MAG: hypothetical protein ACI9JT_000267 [Polaribacter sp.]|jgi:hypothetical protein